MELIERLSCWRALSVILVFWSFNRCVESQYKCQTGTELAGYTIPQGDILIEYGNPLNITCVLYEHIAKSIGPNASSNLLFMRNKEYLPRSMIEVLNETSIRLYVDKPAKVAGDFYTCLLVNQSRPTVCMNYVWVGVHPQPIQDFKCIGLNNDNLTCSWIAPQNYVKTDYNLTFSLTGRAARDFPHRCPGPPFTIETFKNGSKRLGCFWNISTEVQYRQVHPDFYFKFKVKNKFGEREFGPIHFKHFQHVKSNPPENLRVINATWNSIFLSWKVPVSMQTFPPGVHHKIIYICDYDGKDWHLGGLITNNTRTAEVKFNLTGLRHAHCLYDIRVMLRSAYALPDDNSMWSDPSPITYYTSNKIPDEPPKTNIGSFEIVASGNDMQYREAFIYWAHIPEEKRNGPYFGYNVSVIGHPDIEPADTTYAFAVFKNLSFSKSYTFHIWSRNIEGLSESYSSVYVPRQSERIREPSRFTKVEYGNGKYELTWEPAEDAYDVTNYTIFWCSHDRDRPHQCNGQLDWTTIPNTVTAHNQTVNSDGIFQFAISANSKRGSSGMLWAACTVLYNQNIGKLKNIWVNEVGPTYIDVKWKLECSDRITSVEGFIIYYCPVVDRTYCDGPQRNLTLHGSNLQGGTVTGLKPYTTYMLTVAVITTHATYSQQSDPFFNTTWEAAPSLPENFTVKEITNSSITLTWDPPTSKNGVLKHYVISFNNDSQKVDSKRTLKTLTGLQSYKNYLISIKACTVICSNSSDTLNVTTKMGYPSRIRKPSVTFQNDSIIIVTWDRPSEPRGRNDFYEVKIIQQYEYENVSVPVNNVTNKNFPIEHCGDGGKYNTFYIAVRAVNVIAEKLYPGEWSEELEYYCRTPSSLSIYLIVGICSILFLIAMAYLFNKLYKHCKIMRDVEVKLPPGLAPAVTDQTLVPWSAEKRTDDQDRHSPADEELLLVKMKESRHQSGDSSGCSSAHESVTSSLESGSHVSSTSDSGTEQHSPPTDDTRKNSLRLRHTRNRPTINKGYVVMPADPAPLQWPNKPQTPPAGNYCVLGVDPATKVDISDSSNYLAVADAKKVPYIACDAASQPSPYVMTGDLIKTVNPGYIPYNTNVEDVSPKNQSYVVAGNKDMLVTDLLNIGQGKTVVGTEDTPSYVKVSDNISMKPPEVGWQPPVLDSSLSKTGYVSIGDATPAEHNKCVPEHKGYVLQRQFEV